MKQQSVKEPIKCLEQPILTPTPETPVGVEEDIKAETEFQCSVFLGKIIKGRAIQNILYRGRDLSRNHINDLQSKTKLSAVLAIHPDAKKQQRKKSLAHQKHFQRIVNNKKHALEIMKQSEASTIGSLLDFIETELERLQEQRKIQAICMLAEHEKTKRETAEAKRQQTQVLRTRQHEEIYRSMMKASHETVTMYLENVLLEEVENQSDIDARRKIQSMARRIDREASKDIGSQRQMESSLEASLDDSEEVVTDLVTKFVFPEVQKRLARRNMEVRRQSYLLAAHHDLYKQAKDMTGTSMVQGQPSYQEREKVASSLLNDLIKRVISSDDAFGELKSERDIAREEALGAVKKIVKTMFPSRKWQTSGEKIANAMVNDIIRRAVQPKKRQRSFLVRQERVEERPSELLQEIVHDVGEKLWEYAVADVDEETAKIIADDYRYAEGEATSEGSPDGSERKQIVSEEIEGDEKDVEKLRNLSPDGIAVEKLQKYSEDQGDDDGENN